MCGIVLLVCAMLFVRQRFFPENSSPVSVQSPSVIPLDQTRVLAEWQEAVKTILADYDHTHDARSARERLLVVRVPASGRDAHLALFLAMNALAESRPDGTRKLTTARALFMTSSELLTTTPSSTPSTP